MGRGREADQLRAARMWLAPPGPLPPQAARAALQRGRCSEIAREAVMRGRGAAGGVLTRQQPRFLAAERAAVLDAGSDHEMRLGLTLCPWVRAAAVGRLVDDDRLAVRLGVGSHPHCPRRALVRLAGDTDAGESVRGRAAGNPACGPAVLTRLAQDSQQHVRRSTASNPATPRAALEVLAADIEEAVRGAAAAALRGSRAKR